MSSKASRWDARGTGRLPQGCVSQLPEGDRSEVEWILNVISA